MALDSTDRALLALALLAAAVLLTRRRRGEAPGNARLFPAQLNAYAGPHLDRARRETAAFERVFQDTFEERDDYAASIRDMFRHRARVQENLNELRMRLPNDLTMERRFAAQADALDRDMLAHIEDARQRCGVPLLHPGPVDDAWYGAWYRAHNDRVV